MAVRICPGLLCSLSSASIHYFLESNFQVISYGRLNLLTAFVFNFECLDILYAEIGHPSEKLRPFESLESFCCSISSVLNWPCTWMFNFGCLDILWAWIGHPSEMLWPFEFLENFRSSISSILIYHGPQSYTQVKSYGHLNLPRAFLFNFERLDVLLALIGHLGQKL